MEILSLAEVAAELHITSDGVRKLIYRGQLEAHKLSREWYVARAELEAYKVRRRDPGRPPGRPPKAE